jgi:ATP-binding cassette subfamily C exporter for protease/lipase
MARSPAGRTPQNRSTPLAEALKLGTGPLMFAGLFSLASNLLYLALPIYTNLIYSRVLASQSASTLWVLTLGVGFVFVISSVIDGLRAQVLSRFGVLFDHQVASRTFAALFDAVLRRQGGARAQAMRDLDTVRQTIGGPSVAVMFDVPWIPLFLILLYIVDPLIGIATTIGGVILLVLAIAQDRATRVPRTESSEAALQSYTFTEAALRNGEVVRALGMLPTLGRQWAQYRHVSVEAGSRATDKGNVYGGAIRLVRMLIQIAIIAIGAFLVIERSIPSGLLFANMILASRALAPVERIVGSWQGLFAAVEAYKRLDRVLADYEPPVPTTQLPVPTGRLTVENVSFAPAGAPSLVLLNLSFEIQPGEMIGIVGKSGAGKSTLARLMAGIWRPASGLVRLDGADVYTWDREDFGRHVAYQPQNTELFAGTVRSNICRFQIDAVDADIVRAAQAAGAHELILRLPKGYETELGEGGSILSSGQRQRVGLARTLYGDPKVVVLDEPNANLDAEGEAALMEAVRSLKERGSTVVLISHKPGAFVHADRVMVLANGRIAKFGARDQVLAEIMRGPSAPPMLTEAKA